MAIKLNLDKVKSKIHKSKQKQGSVLLIDDERENLDGLQALLETKYTIYSTTSPLKALQIMENQSIDVIISDQRMSEMTGIEFFQKIHHRYPNYIGILLTGYTDINDLIQCVNAGLIYRYLVKPWRPEELLANITQAFDTLHTRRQLKEQHQQLRAEVEERKEAQAQLSLVLQELKETQATLIEQERLRALGEMTSGIAHDFNNILTPIISYVSFLLEDSSLSDEQQEMLSVIHFAAEDGVELIRRLKQFYSSSDSYQDSFAKTEIQSLILNALTLACPRWKGSYDLYLNGELEHHLTPIPAILNESDSTPKSKINTSKYPLKLSVDLEKNLILSINSSEIRQTLVNLLCNSIDAIHLRLLQDFQFKSPEIKISLAFTANHLQLTLLDNGIGMSAETLNLCRTPFFSTKGQKGTGLGLAMVEKTMKHHQGTLDIESSINQSTRINLYFPLHLIQDDSPHELK